MKLYLNVMNFSIG